MLVWVGALAWALAYTRTVAIAAAMTAPLLAAVVSAAVPASDVGDGRQRRRQHRVEAITLLVGLGLGVAVGCVTLPATGVGVAADRMPVALDPVLDRLPAGTVVMDEYGLGGYLGYRHPDLVPVIDERTELFSVEYVKDYLDARGVRPGWPQFLERTGAKAALVPADAALADALARALNWRDAGVSGAYVLLVAPELSLR